MAPKTSWTERPTVASALVIFAIVCAAVSATHDTDRDAVTLADVARRLARVEQVKRNILDQLGLADPPPTGSGNRTTAVSGDDHVMATYRRSLQQLGRHDEDGAMQTAGDVDENEVEDSSDIEDVEPAKIFYSFAARPLRHCAEHSNPSERILLFRVDIPETKNRLLRTDVASATLRLRVQQHRATSDTAHQTVVTIYRLTERRRHGNITIFERQLVTSRTVMRRPANKRRRWEEFDVKPAVDWLLEDGVTSNFLRLAVTVTGANDTDRFVLNGCGRSNGNQPKHSPRHRPILNILAYERSPENDALRPRRRGGNGARSRRSASSSRSRSGSVARPVVPPDPVCTLTDGETRCCRRSMLISFRDIGWDWVVEPESYEAFYCEGSCPPGYRSHSNYATIRQLLLASGQSNRRGGPPVRAPVCRGTRMAPLPLVLNIDGRQRVHVVENMIIEHCRCV